MASLDPAALKLANPETVGQSFRVLFSEFEGGQEQRRLKELFPTRTVEISGQYMDIALARALWQFHMDRRGAFETFNYFHFSGGPGNPGSWEQEYVGTGDGVQTLWNCPSRDAAGVMVYIDSAIQTEGSNYTFTARAGADGADRIAFTVAPPLGSFITMSFVGTLKIRCRFAETSLSFEHWWGRLVNVGIKLKGLRNA